MRRESRYLWWLAVLACLALSPARLHALMPYYAGARAMGMGGAFSTLAFESSALYWNPAGLSYLTGQEFTGMYTRDALDTRYSFAAYGRSIVGWGGAAAGWCRTANSFEKTDVWGNRNGSADVTSDVFLLGLGCFSGLPVSMGVTGKFISERIDGFSLSGMSLDYGALYEARPLRLAVVWENMLSSGLQGSSVRGGEAGEQLPSSIRLGISVFGQSAVNVDPGEAGGAPARGARESSEPVRLDTALAADVVIPLDGRQAATVSPGLEAWVNDTMGFRAGMKEMRDYTVGLSLWIPWLRLDYAFIFSRDLENSHVFSTSFYF
ncbi:MAG: PorV/PorQ family protein [Endomicrobiales bacterium]